MRDVIVRLHNLSALGERGIHVTDVSRHLAGLARGLLQLFLVRVRVVASIRTAVPNYIQFLASLKRGPGVVGNHRHASQRLEMMWRRKWLDRDGLLDTLHLQRSL